MKKLLFIIMAAFCAVVLICLNYSCKNSISRDISLLDTISDDEMALSYLETDLGRLRIDTIMFAEGHSFGYSGDISMWDGWYFDTIRVGDDIMLTYDSISPSSMKLGLITRNLIIDMGDPNAPDMIKHFFEPINGFKRFSKQYETCVDSIIDEKYGEMRSTGYITFVVDYADSCTENAPTINRFISEIMGNSDNSQVNVPPLTSLFIGHKTSNGSKRKHTNMADNMESLCECMKDIILEDWRNEEDLPYLGSCARTIDIRAHLANSRFVTFSIYDYDRIGSGHGMYTETFHSIDLTSGQELINKDLFKPHTLDKITLLLLEVMANDPHYSNWHPGLKSSSQILQIIENWQSPNPLLEGTEFEEPENEFSFILPEGALTDSGVVFSFQPYEIDCWAAGTYHFIIPYKDLIPYLTPKAKKLIAAQ